MKLQFKNIGGTNGVCSTSAHEFPVILEKPEQITDSEAINFKGA